MVVEFINTETKKIVHSECNVDLSSRKSWLLLIEKGQAITFSGKIFIVNSVIYDFDRNIRSIFVKPCKE